MGQLAKRKINNLKDKQRVFGRKTTVGTQGHLGPAASTSRMGAPEAGNRQVDAGKLVPRARAPRVLSWMSARPAVDGSS